MRALEIADGAERLARLRSLRALARVICGPRSGQLEIVLAKADGGRIPLRSERVDLGALLVRVRDRFADRAAERARSIDVELDGTSVLVADPERIRQALQNLVENALRHGKGTFTLRALDVPGGVVLEVSDEGRDLPVEFAPLAFERFTRVERYPHRQRRGLRPLIAHQGSLGRQRPIQGVGRARSAPADEN